MNENETSKQHIVIIGGGAAGMMTAATLAERQLAGELTNTQVTLIERNPYLGAKVIISGGGRCNVTTGVEDLKEVLKAYPRGAKFLRTAMYDFPPAKMRQWVEDQGVPTKKEADNRVFPKSDDGKDIVKIFERLLQKSNVKVMCKRIVTEVQKDAADQFLIKLNTDETLLANTLVITTGGQAYRKTGSKGDGYTFSQALGHSITALGPSLNAYVIWDNWIKELAGVSFKEVKLRFLGTEHNKPKDKIEFTGPMLFTHKGITGPAVFALSSLAAFQTFSKNIPATIELDLFPNQNHDELSSEIKQLIAKNPKKHFQNVLGFLTPKISSTEENHSLANKFARELCKQIGISEDKRANEISKKEVNKIVSTLKQLKLKAIGQSAGDEFVTAGGVELKEVDSKTMQSKITTGLYFAGEILNVDGFTGGYNLQASWAAGRKAGKSIDSNKLEA